MGLVEELGGAVLLQKKCQVGVGFEVSKGLHHSQCILSSLLSDQEVSSQLFLPPRHCLAITDSNLGNNKPNETLAFISCLHHCFITEPEK